MLVTAGIGAVLGGGIDLGVQLWNSHGNFNQVNWGEVGVSAAAGGIGGLTFGIGTAAMGGGLGASIVSGAGSGVISGQSQIIGSNVIYGNSWNQGILQPKDLAFQGVVGGTLGGVGYGVNKLFTSASQMTTSQTTSSMEYSRSGVIVTYKNVLPEGNPGAYHDTVLNSVPGDTSRVTIHGTLQGSDKPLYNSVLFQENTQNPFKDVINNLWKWVSGKT